MKWKHTKHYQKVHGDNGIIYFVDYVKYDVPEGEIALDIMKVRTPTDIIFMRNATKILVNNIASNTMEQIETLLYEIND